MNTLLAWNLQLKNVLNPTQSASSKNLSLQCAAFILNNVILHKSARQDCLHFKQVIRPPSSSRLARSINQYLPASANILVSYPSPSFNLLQLTYRTTSSHFFRSTRANIPVRHVSTPPIYSFLFHTVTSQFLPLPHQCRVSWQLDHVCQNLIETGKQMCRSAIYMVPTSPSHPFSPIYPSPCSRDCDVRLGNSLSLLRSVALLGSPSHHPSKHHVVPVHLL